MTVMLTTQLEEITCGTCGILHAVPMDWIYERRKMAGDIYCPNGCKRTWSESEAQRLQKQLTVKEMELRAEKCKALNALRELGSERLEKEKAERKLKRVSRGVCPCCNRTFQNLARHMATKHSEKPQPKINNL